MKSEFIKNIFIAICGLIAVVGFVAQLDLFSEAITYRIYSQNACYELELCEELYGNSEPPNFDYYFSFAGSELLFGEFASVEDLVDVKLYLGFFEVVFFAVGKKFIWDRHYKIVQVSK